VRVVVEADGGSRGNPGPAGYGAVVFDAGTGEVLAERKEGIGETTNNVAEYRGLIAGLTAARGLGADTVAVRMDSKLVIEQMSGRWQVKHPAMQPLNAEARQLAAGFDSVTFEWIPRERNKHADRLANEAMDAQAGIDKPAAEAAKPTAPAWTGAKGTPTRLLLLRHGQTPLTAERRYSGRGEISLSELGEQQAAAAAARLAKMPDIAAVVASPLTRTVQTARAVADAVGVELATDDGLIETDFGRWEGLTFREAAERDPDLHRRWLSDTSIAPPDGESFDAVHRRVRRSRDDLISRHGGSTIVVVSHVTPIKSLLRMALDAGPSLLYRLHLDTASLSIAEFYPDGNASVRLFNDTSHLG
jgi:probable phosphoglycerate mutase